MSRYDFSASIEQTLINRITKDTTYPFKLYEERYRFDPKKSKSGDSFVNDGEDVSFPALKKWASKNNKSELSEEDRELAEEILDAVNEVEEEQENYLECKKKFDAVEHKRKPKWEGVREAELKSLKKFDFPAKAHLAWVRVVLKKSPNIDLKVPKTKISGLEISVGATGELYVKMPKLVCVKRWHGFCYKWKIKWKWRRLARATFKSISTKSDVSLTFSVAKKVIVVAQGVFDKLRLNYPILREIPIERFIKPREFNVFHARKMLGLIPLVEEEYVVGNVSLPKGDGLQVNILLREA